MRPLPSRVVFDCASLTRPPGHLTCEKHDRLDPVARTRKGLRSSVPHPQTKSLDVAPTPRTFNNLWIYSGLAAAIFAVYGQVWGHAFLNYDDPDYVTANALVQSGLTPTGFLSAFASAHASNWIPLTWLSHMLDFQQIGRAHV